MRDKDPRQEIIRSITERGLYKSNSKSVPGIPSGICFNSLTESRPWDCVFNGDSVFGVRYKGLRDGSKGRDDERNELI